MREIWKRVVRYRRLKKLRKYRDMTRRKDSVASLPLSYLENRLEGVSINRVTEESLISFIFTCRRFMETRKTLEITARSFADDLAMAENKARLLH